jgi:hypothetical protein
MEPLALPGESHLMVVASALVETDAMLASTNDARDVGTGRGCAEGELT